MIQINDICYFQQGGQWYMGKYRLEKNNNYHVEVLSCWAYDDFNTLYSLGYHLSLPAEKVFFERPAEKIVNEEFYK